MSSEEKHPDEHLDYLDEEARGKAERFFGELPEDWIFGVLDNYVEKFIDYRGKTPPKAEGGIHMLSAANIKDGFVLPGRKEKFVTEDTYDEWLTKGTPRKKDVIVTTEAPVGEVGIIRGDERFLPAQRLITMRAGPKLDPDYLKFAIQYEKTQKQLDSYASGTTVRSFNQTDLRNTVIPIPPLQEQQKIGGMLSRLERKYNSNKRIMTKSEAVAETIFRDWFVEYGPYTDFKNSEIGEIPEGFEVIELGDVIECGRGYSYTSEHLDKENEIDESYPMINLKNVSEGGGFRTDGYKFYTEEGLKDRYHIDEGDLVVAITDLTQEGRVVGSPAVIPRLDSNHNIISQDLAKIHSTSIPVEFLYYLMKMDSFQNHAKARATGTTVLHLSLTSIKEYKFALPPKTDISRFVQISTKIIERNANAIDENSTILDLRKRLLDQLVSGELRLVGEKRREELTTDA